MFERSYFFKDVDECKEKTHDCDQNCINNIGSYICRCNPGYRLQDDKKTCRGRKYSVLLHPIFIDVKIFRQFLLNIDDSYLLQQVLS